MDLISLLVTLAIVGGVVWLIVTYIPMPATIRKVIIAIAVIVVVLWLIGIFFGGVPTIPLPHFHSR